MDMERFHKSRHTVKTSTFPLIKLKLERIFSKFSPQGYERIDVHECRLYISAAYLKSISIVSDRS